MMTKNFIGHHDLEFHGVKYGRLLTKDGHTISSEWIKQNKLHSRNNYSIQARRTIDKYAHRPNVPPEFIYTNIYAKVIYFLIHNYNGKIKMLAYIQCVSKIITEKYNCKYFTKFCSFEFIDIRCIDHCVGFMKINSKYYILDRENEVDDSTIENL
ncbi:unnamed protein product [Rhizophagus irregularis]|nr:unnamed protein product [Rhizophagus irregularis]